MWKKILKIIKNPLFVLSLILVVGLILRLLDINKTSFWYDEAFTGDVIKLSWKEMFAVIAADKVHPPLFYVLIRCWSMLFGVTQFSLRGLSVFFGLGSIGLAYIVGRSFFNKEKYPIAGLVLASVIAISPFFIAYSNEARAYSFIAFLALGLAYAVLKFLSTKIPKEKIIFLITSIILAIILCCTHYLQIVYVIAIICAGVIYKLVFTEKGLNKKWLIILLGIAAIGIIAIIFLPLKQLVSGIGVSAMGWIGEVKWYEIVRVYYSYFLGVVRYSLGVPPVRELIISIPILLWGVIMFCIHITGYIFVLLSKRIEKEDKRKITFFFFLSLITFLGFYILGLLGFNCFVERYTIAGGIILLLSFWMIITLLIKNWYILIPVGLYVVSTLMLLPMPRPMDYRNIAQNLESMNNVQRYVFASPMDLVSTMFYMKNTAIYYYYEEPDQYSGWALLGGRGLNSSNLKNGDVLVVPNWDEARYLLFGKNESDDIGEGLKAITIKN